ncbi:uncharacterized protein LOC121975349 isoform X3 [Zingiber officinale]|uniref:uncharacterized protein LOC121975349 isoform X3 n=1 Tax=Zingiber officinale TaxID=94328 RepID=UPI001C4CF8EF|nr:uncharacterized protein LOC121975349 isoform X3 [Zingiber officinale]
MPARTRTNLMRRSLPFPLRTRRSLALIFLPGEKIENINDQYCTVSLYWGYFYIYLKFIVYMLYCVVSSMLGDLSFSRFQKK